MKNQTSQYGGYLIFAVLGYLQEIKKMIYKTKLYFYDSFVMPKVLL